MDISKGIEELRRLKVDEARITELKDLANRIPESEVEDIDEGIESVLDKLVSFIKSLSDFCSARKRFPPRFEDGIFPDSERGPKDPPAVPTGTSRSMDAGGGGGGGETSTEKNWKDAFWKDKPWDRLR